VFRLRTVIDSIMEEVRIDGQKLSFLALQIYKTTVELEQGDRMKKIVLG